MIVPHNLTDRIIAAYAFTSDDKQRLTAMLSVAFLSAKAQAYQKSQEVSRCAVSWRPTQVDMSKSQLWASEQVENIVRAYEVMLRNIAEQVIDGSSEYIFRDRIRQATTIVRGHLVDFLKQRAQQIAQYTWGSGTNDGTKQLIDAMQVDGDKESPESPAVARLMAQVQDILTRLDRAEEIPGEYDDEEEDGDDEDEETEYMITEMLQSDEDEQLSALERNWATFDAARQPKGRKPAATVADKARQRALAAQVKEQMQEMKAEAKAEAQEAKQDAKEQKAEARQDVKEAREKKQAAAARVKADKLKAHLAKVAATAKAKAARMAATAQKKAQTTAAHAAKSQARQAKAAAKSAKLQAKAAKALQSLISTVSAKAQLYQALSTRKAGKSWTAQDAQDAKSIAGDLHQLLQMTTSHQDEADSKGLLNNLNASISELQAQHGISAARAGVLQKLEQKMSLQRSMQIDEEEEWLDEEETQEEKRYTISELLQMLQGQMQTTSIQDQDDYRPTNTAIESDGYTVTSNRPSASTSENGDASAEYKRWRQRAIDDVKSGKTQRGFSSIVIPEHIHRWISDELTRCTTADEVRSIFNRVRDMSHEPIITSKDELAKSVHAVFSKVTQRGHSELATMEG